MHRIVQMVNVLTTELLRSSTSSNLQTVGGPELSTAVLKAVTASLGMILSLVKDT